MRASTTRQADIVDWMLRGVLSVNAALFVLTFIPAFSGFGPRPGLADRLWGRVRFGGWRADVVWMCASSALIVGGGLRGLGERGPRRTTGALCWSWLPCFVVYLGYIVIHMFG